MNNNETQKLQNDAINLLELIEDTSEHFCDEYRVSGEQFYIMMKALGNCTDIRTSISNTKSYHKIY